MYEPMVDGNVGDCLATGTLVVVFVVDQSQCVAPPRQVGKVDLLVAVNST